jgi:DNA-binding transcriptional ArsR family regulator
MALTPPTSDRLVELVAARFRVLGHPVRVKLLNQLRNGEATVHELTVAVEGGQQNVSQHLAVLHNAGVISRRKDGIRVWYALVDPYIPNLLRHARDSVTRHVDELSRSIEPSRNDRIAD